MNRFWLLLALVIVGGLGAPAAKGADAARRGADPQAKVSLDRIAATTARAVTDELAKKGFIPSEIDFSRTQKRVEKTSPPPVPGEAPRPPSRNPSAYGDCTEFTFSNGLQVMVTQFGLVMSVDNPLAEQRSAPLRFPSKPKPTWGEDQAVAEAVKLVNLCLPKADLKISRKGRAHFSHTAEYGDEFGGGRWYVELFRVTDDGLPVDGDGAYVGIDEKFGPTFLRILKTTEFDARKMKASNAKITKAEAIALAKKETAQNPDELIAPEPAATELVVSRRGRLVWDVGFSRSRATVEGTGQAPWTNYQVDALTGETLQSSGW